LTAVFLIPGAATEKPLLAVALLSVAAFFLEMNIGPAWAVVMDVGGEYAGTVSGMMNMFGSLAGGLSPIIFAAVWERTGLALFALRMTQGGGVGRVAVYRSVSLGSCTKAGLKRGPLRCQI